MRANISARMSGKVAVPGYDFNSDTFDLRVGAPPKPDAEYIPETLKDLCQSGKRTVELPRAPGCNGLAPAASLPRSGGVGKGGRP